MNISDRPKKILLTVSEMNTFASCTASSTGTLFSGDPRDLTTSQIEQLTKGFAEFLFRCRDGGKVPYGGFGAQCFPVWETPTDGRLR